MTILYPNPAAVKPINRVFGKGLLRTYPNHRVEYSASDAAWWAQESAAMAQARDRAELNAEVEEMARESRYGDMIRQGYPTA